ncbi:MAG: class I SAM-dependent methyltransferase [Caldilineaceae bacterium]
MKQWLLRITPIVLIALLTLIGLAWRFSSRRHQLPCPSWLGWMVEMDNPFTKVNRAHTIVELLQLQPGMKVLDAGCGLVRLTIPLAQTAGQEGEVVAMDVQEEMLRQVQANAQAAELQNVQYLLAGLGEVRCRRRTSIGPCWSPVLGEIPNQVAALQELYGALQPGGILSVTEVIFDPHFQRRAAVVRRAGSRFQRGPYLAAAWPIRCTSRNRVHG